MVNVTGAVNNLVGIMIGLVIALLTIVVVGLLIVALAPTVFETFTNISDITGMPTSMAALFQSGGVMTVIFSIALLIMMILLVVGLIVLSARNLQGGGK